MQSWGRWISRGLVLGGLVGLVAVSYRYGTFVTVFGDTPCARGPERCDDGANLLAQRELVRWYLAAGCLLGVGVVGTAMRRWLAPRVPEAEPTAPQGADSIAGSALTSFGRGAGSAVLLVLTAIFWLFGGTAIYLAVTVVWLVVLTWLLDRAHRRRNPDDGDLGALLVSGAAAVAGIALGCAAAVALAAVAGLGSESSMFLLVPVVLALGTGAGTAAIVISEQALTRRWRRRGATNAAPVVVAASVALVGALVLAATPVGRDLVAGVRRDLFPDRIPPMAGTVAPILPDPRPDLSFTEPPEKPTPTPTPAPVVAARACTVEGLTLTARGWDSATGSSAVTILATNGSATACWVRGFPTVRLEQGGKDLALTVTRSPAQRFGSGAVVPDRRIGLVAHGGQASFDLWWRGYRDAADHDAAQTLEVTASGTVPLRLGLTSPYLLDVVEDAEVTVMRWTVPPRGSG